MKLRLPKPGHGRDALFLAIGLMVGAAFLDASYLAWARIFPDFPNYRAPFKDIEQTVAFQDLDGISEQELVRRYGAYATPSKGSRFEQWKAAYIVGPGGWMPSQGKFFLLLDVQGGKVVTARLESGETGDLNKSP